MAKQPRKQRNKKTLAERLAIRAKSLIKSKGHLIQFVGGTATTTTATFGMSRLAACETQLAMKEELTLAIERNLRTERRRWTVTFAFIHSIDDEIKVITDHFYVEDVDAATMGYAATQHISDMWRQQDASTRIGQVWISTPASVTGGGHEMIARLDQWLEAQRFFDVKHMLRRLTIIGLETLELEAKESRRVIEDPAALLEGVA